MPPFQIKIYVWKLSCQNILREKRLKATILHLSQMLASSFKLMGSNIGIFIHFSRKGYFYKVAIFYEIYESFLALNNTSIINSRIYIALYLYSLEFEINLFKP